LSEYLHWDPGIRVGVDEIDLEHRTFVLLINQLDQQRDHPQMAPRILQALVKYAAFHFQSEENIMYPYAYPFFEEHWKLHLSLLEHLNIVLQKFRSGDADSAEVLDFLKEWYCHHTSQEDMKFAEYLRLQGAA